MSIFDATTKILRAIADPLTDHKLPQPKSLSFQAITSQTALAGTTGQHCNLIHGDHWHEIDGQDFQTVNSHQTIKVLGNHKEMLVGQCYQNIIGPHIVQNNNVRNETRLGAFTLDYGDNSTASDSSGDKTIKPTDASIVAIADFEWNLMTKLEINDIHVELHPLLHLEVEDLHLQANICCIKDVALFDADTKTMLTHFFGVKFDAGASADANPRVNAGPNIAATTPFS